TDSPFGGDQNIRFLEQQVVELRARLAANLQNVFESFGRDEGDATASTLEQGIRSNCGTADNVERGWNSRAETYEDIVNSVCDGSGRLFRLRRNFQNFRFAIPKKNAVGECAASVGCDSHAAGSLP